MRKILLSVLMVVISSFVLLEAAMAEWAEVPTDQISLTITGVSDTEFTFTLENETDADIVGVLRLTITPALEAALPMTYDGVNDSGSSYYYDVVTAEEDIFKVDEVVTITVTFDDPTSTDDFTAIVELNDESVDSNIFRKIISKTPEFYSGEALIRVIPRYVPAQNTKGQLVYKTEETAGFIPCDDEETEDVIEACPKNDWDAGIITKVKPIVVTYLQEIEGTEFNNVPLYTDETRLAHDVYTAVSLDDGTTWKRKNVSKTSKKSSFQLPNGVDYPGDSESADVAVAGENVLVTWVDKYCYSGNPWDITDEEDIYQVKGPQRSVDYEEVKGDEDPRPDLGVRPFSCLWASRGVLQTDKESEFYGTVVWYKAEQITTGRRDVFRNFTAAEEPDPSTYPGNGKNKYQGKKWSKGKAKGLVRRYYGGSNGSTPAPGGFGITWQEDPKGLKTGKGRGPGAGMSGASANHKTDIWYTWMEFNDFAEIDEDFVPNSDEEDMLAESEDFDEDDKVVMPHAQITFNPPVRITDNAVCKERNPEPIMAHVHLETFDGEPVLCDYSYEGGTNSNPVEFEDLLDVWECPKCGLPKASFSEEETLVGYRNEGAPYCEQFADNPRVDGDGNIVDPSDPAYASAFYTTDDGIPLDGNTGATRANLAFVNWKGETLALVAYEETKGIGTGGDKEAAAMEQAAPFPLVYLSEDDPHAYTYYKDEDGNVVEEPSVGWTGGFTNRDCRSCHYDYIVPQDRYIPKPTKEKCEAVGGTWRGDAVNDFGLKAYFPYTGYPFSTVDPVSDQELEAQGVAPNTMSNSTPCVKFEGNTVIYPRDFTQREPDALYVLPEHLPGWHSKGLDCTKCHLAYNTKDVDEDTVKDRADMCMSTPIGDLTVDLDPDSDRYGCAETQTPGDPDNNKDLEPRYRHGKNVYYHHFAFNDPDTIAHGDKINLENANGWTAPGTDSKDENARRVRLMTNPLYGQGKGRSRADLTLGILYKQGKDGQGAPADAFIRFFRNGFDISNIDEGELNLSSSTPYIYKAEEETEVELGEVDYDAGDGTFDLLSSGHNTPHIESFYWTDANMYEESGLWYEDEETGEKLYNDDGTPYLIGNPFDNVFSTRGEIRGDFVAVAFAYSTNWAAARNAKDHYDFYVRTSSDGGKTWTLPVNVSELKNHQETVSDCRLLLPPETLFEPGSQSGSPRHPYYNGIPRHDYFNDDVFFVAIGTQENIAQPGPNEQELEEVEIFLDLYYSRTIDRGETFEGVEWLNPKYEEDALPYIDNITLLPTEEQYDENGIENEANPAYGEYLYVFDWLAKGDAFQGDVQVATNPAGSVLHSIWEQELALDDESSMSHFQGRDVWYRKISYDMPDLGDIDDNGVINKKDLRMLTRKLWKPAVVIPQGDLNNDGIITRRDLKLLKKRCTNPRCR